MENGNYSSWVVEELQGIALPDKRFFANIISIAEHLEEHTGVSFSAACGERLRKSAWRLFATEDLCLLSAHQQKTLGRCGEEQTILVVEDTTDIVYRQPHKQGMGELGGSNYRSIKGLNMHTALALATTGECLGIVHQKIWAPTANKAGQQRSHFAIEDKETIKWIETLRTVNKHWQQQPAQQVIVIADREADFFEHYGEPRNDNVQLLIRVQQKKRRVVHEGKDSNITEVLARLQPLGEGEVKVWRKPGEAERMAAVQYYATTITVPPTFSHPQAAQVMQLVWVWEERPPAGNTAIEWVLLTNLPAETLQQAKQVCDWYSCRWTVERFHYILKSGLLIEQLQIESFTRLAAALQLYSLIGWHVLWLQRLAKAAGSTPATQYIEQQTLEVARAVSNQKIETVQDFVVATAILGGFIPSRQQPLPGEKTLWRGIIPLSIR